MTKDRVESVKNKTSTKKRHSSGGSKSFEAFLKKQNDVVASLKSELQDCIAEKQQIKCAIIDKNKRIQELQNSIEDRDNEVQKLNNDLSAAREENTKTLHDFYLFKEKFYELEAHYDKACQLQNREIDNLKRQLDTQKTTENQQIKELTSSYEDMEKQLHERNQAFVHINLDYTELVRKSEKIQQEYARLQADFENYQKKVVADKNEYDDKINQDFASLKNEICLKEEHFDQEIAALKDELSEKDDIIRQCIKDRKTMEEEKNNHIKELNYKINQIEKVFGQPTKSVTPMKVIPSTPQSSAKLFQTPLKGSSNVQTNVAVAKPQIRRESQETNTDTNSEHQTPEVSMRSRPKKIPRPTNTNSNNLTSANVSKSHANNRKRGYSSLRNPSPPSRNDDFSTPSSDDDDDDFVYPLWRPKNNKPDHFVAETETDASEGFSKRKRSKK